MEGRYLIVYAEETEDGIQQYTDIIDNISLSYAQYLFDNSCASTVSMIVLDLLQRRHKYYTIGDKVYPRYPEDNP